ncbi:MAG: ABC transporter ATP-binding protein [Rhizobiaceae bacterium]|nr:ABC transporter ATP-binding protein [Rhizobiaceae bacterium]
MQLANFLFRPFESWVKPLDLPIQRMPNKGPVSLIWHFAKMFRGVLLVVFLLSVISASISLSIIWALAFVVDGVTELGAKAFLEQNTTMLLLLFILFAVIDPLISFVSSAFMSQTVQTLLPAALRWQSHKAVEGQDIAFFEDLFAGQVASRIAQVTGSIQNQLMVVMQRIPRVSIQFLGSLGLLIVLAWPLAIPVFFWIVANILLAWIVVPQYLARSKKVAAASSRATGAMTDVYSNIAMVKLFAAEDSEAGAIRDVIRETIDTQHSVNRAYILSNSIAQLMNAALIVSMFAIGLWGILDSFVSVGDFVAAVTVSRGLASSSYAFIGLGQSITRALGTITDAMPVITSPPTIKDKPDAVELVVKKGTIHFDGVSFAYDKNTEPVIKDLSLSIKPGEKVGVVGLSGAGKSTLVSLLLRLRDVDAGAITIDGKDIRDVTQMSLRRNIGVVTQDITLLHRSVRDNIRYGKSDATDQEVHEAAQAAKASEFIEVLTDNKGRLGLDAFTGDKGVKLSGGQRQRVAIARVLLKDAPILVLDEATSALDSEAEASIQENLDEIMEGKTTLAIAHRLSTISSMDRLIVMEHGQIVEQGTHNKLIKNKGLYARLWKRQSGGFLEHKNQF